MAVRAGAAVQSGMIFVIALGIGVAGFIAAFLVTHLHDRWKKREKISIGLMAGISMTLIAQAILSALAGSPPTAEQNPAASTAAPTSSVSAEPPPDEPSRVDESATPRARASAPSASATVQEPAEQELTANISEYYLAELGALETEKEDRPGGCTGGCTGFGQGAGRIEGKIYPQSYLMEVAADGRRSTAVWNLGRSCTTLDMTIGLEDLEAPQSEVTFTLSLDGQTPEILATVPLGTAAKITQKSIMAAAQLEIAAYVSGPEAPSQVPIVLGDARITCQGGAF